MDFEILSKALKFSVEFRCKSLKSKETSGVKANFRVSFKDSGGCQPVTLKILWRYSGVFLSIP
tara:strand:+ start:699 stop:887 length:189 start_codon:yes stop_codon:yes gene_type:complete